jgi:serine/arginine repetitive matrix protein 2
LNVNSAHADGTIVAKNTELKDIQRTYNFLVSEIQSLLDAYAAQHAEQQSQRATIPVPAGPARAITPSFFSNLKPKTRIRSNTNSTSPLPSETEAVEDPTVTKAYMAYKALSSAFYLINSKYHIIWECADLLIELGGGGNANANISAPPTSSSAPLISQSPVGFADQRRIDSKRGRERAITLAGDESKIPHPPLVIPSDPSEPVVSNHDAPFLHKDPSPPSMSWRASTGRHDLSQRQLVLLREMINNMNAHTTIAADADDDARRHSQVDDFIPEEPSLVPSELHTHPRSLHVGVHKEWRWGDARNSTITLPSEDSVGFDVSGKTSAEKKRRSGKLGMSGLRDLLLALKRSTIEGAAVGESNATPPVPNIPIHSTTSLSTESSTGSRWLRKLPHRHPGQHSRKPKTGMVHETVGLTLRGEKEWELDPGGIHARSPHGPDLFTTAKPSPRRPSLASIFRIGRHRPANNFDTPGVPPNPMTLEVAEEDLHSQSSGIGKDSSSTDEEDWDTMDSASDLDTAAKGLSITDRSATVRGGSQHERKKKKNLCLQHDSFHPPPLLIPLGPVVISNRSFSASQPSICGTEYQPVERLHPSPSIPSRSTRLSDVEEHIDDGGCNFGSSSSMRSTSQTYYKTQACILKAGTQLAPMSSLSDSRLVLAMTPENIKPLLKNAKDVQTRLLDCIAEIRVLVNKKSIGNSTVPMLGDVSSA